MSEYQYIAFRAVDGPVSEKNLEYMRQQSTRAEITSWSFDNEYQYGDFRGNALEMLRRGYDLHLHYANFGIRKLCIRIPDGLPDGKAAEPYLSENGLTFVRDKQGSGGVLCIEPAHEPGDLEDLWALEGLIERLVPLRAEILDGDLRPLYLAHLATASGMDHDPEETREAPIPAGLDKLSDAQRALSELYGISHSLIAAAALDGPPLSARSDAHNQYAEWLQSRPAAAKDAWLAQWMADPHSSARRELLTEFRSSHATTLWPTSLGRRTIAQLQDAAEEIRRGAERKAAANAARQRAKRLAGMAADPARTLRETERLVKQRRTEAYGQIATSLTELREALAGSQQAGLAEQQALKLKTENPTLHRLSAELRRAGLLRK